MRRWGVRGVRRWGVRGCEEVGSVGGECCGFERISYIDVSFCRKKRQRKILSVSLMILAMHTVIVCSQG